MTESLAQNAVLFEGNCFPSLDLSFFPQAPSMPHVQAPTHMSDKGYQECHGWHPGKTTQTQSGVAEQLVYGSWHGDLQMSYDIVYLQSLLGWDWGVITMSSGGLGVPGFEDLGISSLLLSLL